MSKKSILALGFACATAAVVAAPLASAPADAGVNHQQAARVELGRRLFFDETASAGNQFACSSCHDPEYGFTDRRVKSVDENGPSLRHSQTLLELKGDGFHWDGEFLELEQLLVARLSGPTESRDAAQALLQAHYDASMDAKLSVDEGSFRRRLQSFAPVYYGSGPVTPGRPVTPVAIANRLDDDGRYAQLFKTAYGSAKVSTDRMVRAMADYMGSLQATKSPWDEYRSGHRGALTEQQRRGLELFEGKAGCATCHPTRGPDARSLSDGKFHNTGVAYRTTSDNWDPSPLTPRAAADTGHGTQTFAKEHTGKFKTPTLRDVATRPPYMHDGSFASLRDVVDYYAGGGTRNEHLDASIRSVGLDVQEREDIVAFLHSLTGEERPGLGDLPRYRPDETRLQLLGLDGRPLPDLKVRVVPAGDRLRGTDEMPEHFTVTSDTHGWLRFPFPASTHVRLESDAHEIGLSRLIPDSATRLSFLATPRDKVAVRVRLAKGGTKPAELVAVPLVAGRTTSDARVTFTRLRSLGRDEALYVADRDDVYLGMSGHGFQPDDIVVAQFSGALPGSATLSLGLRQIELAGGQSEPIDLRPEPSFDARVSGPLGPRRERERKNDVDPARGGGGEPMGQDPGPFGGGDPSPPDIGGSGGGGGLPSGGGAKLPSGPDTRLPR